MQMSVVSPPDRSIFGEIIFKDLISWDYPLKIDVKTGLIDEKSATSSEFISSSSCEFNN